MFFVSHLVHLSLLFVFSHVTSTSPCKEYGSKKNAVFFCDDACKKKGRTTRVRGNAKFHRRGVSGGEKAEKMGGMGVLEGRPGYVGGGIHGEGNAFTKRPIAHFVSKKEKVSFGRGRERGSVRVKNEDGNVGNGERREGGGGGGVRKERQEKKRKGVGVGKSREKMAELLRSASDHLWKEESR